MAFDSNANTEGGRQGNPKLKEGEALKGGSQLSDIPSCVLVASGWLPLFLIFYFLICL